MQYPMRIKVIEDSSGFQVMCEILHPMENGRRRHPGSDKIIPQNYITQVVFRLNEVIQAEILLGQYVSANPVIGTHFSKLTRGDTIAISWQDIAGNGGSASQIFDQ